MECLLIGGAETVGKSETIYRLANRLLLRGFVVISGSIPSNFDDFRCVLKGINTFGVNITIIINSPSDNIPIINDFKTFYDSSGAIYDIFISSVRDGGFYPRNDFFNIMQINNINNSIMELPLGKVTRRGGNFSIALTWYQNQIDNLIDNILINQPFNL